MRSATYTLHRGSAPLLVSLPHAGTVVPAALRHRLLADALVLADTDWHVDRLYDFARGLGASLIVPRHSRYVVDLNRPPQDEPLYAGANNTGLCPVRAFSGAALYRSGAEPDQAESEARRARYWQPYHAALAAGLERLRDRHGHAVLWDGHSIRSELPWLFAGRLPDLNLGTAGGASCAARLRAALRRVLEGQQRYRWVVDGRFRGGYITRHYGDPGHGIHAVQLEMCWSAYMDEQPPWVIDPERAAQLAPVLGALLQAALDWRPDG